MEVKFLIPSRRYTFAVKAFDKSNFTGPYSEEFVCGRAEPTGVPLPISELCHSGKLVCIKK